LAKITCWRRTVVQISAGVYQCGARGTWLKYTALATSSPFGTRMGGTYSLNSRASSKQYGWLNHFTR
jgi:hypothetical protein